MIAKGNKFKDLEEESNKRSSSHYPLKGALQKSELQFDQAVDAASFIQDLRISKMCDVIESPPGIVLERVADIIQHGNGLLDMTVSGTRYIFETRLPRQ